MDPFGFAAAAAAPANGFNVPFANARRDGWSPMRDELRELISRLRARYGRRTLFRRGDVERIVAEMRWPNEWPNARDPPVGPRRLFGEDVVIGAPAPRTPDRTHERPVRRQRRMEVDLTCDEVLE